MTDRHAGYIVALDEDVREDDAQATIAAIRQIRGVLSVTPVISDARHMVARAQARGEIVARLHKVVEDWV